MTNPLILMRVTPVNYKLVQGVVRGLIAWGAVTDSVWSPPF